jgi:hypothetical protein
MAFHQGQRDAGNQIIDKFRQGLFFAVLLAQMQSGKTGCYLFIAYEMIRLGVVDRAVIICGSAETSLREQAKKDKKDALVAYQHELLDNDDKDGLSRLLNGKVDVHFSNDLADINEIGGRTLIVHEECHMAQSKSNKPYKEFYRKNGLEGALLGDFARLRDNSIYILGVSATPFSELVANHRVIMDDRDEEENQLFAQMGVEPEEKYIHQMLPGDGYLGVPDFYRAGSIKFESQKIETMKDHFFQVLRDNRVKYLGKYCIVRTFESKETYGIILEGCKQLGYDCLHSFAGEKGIKNILENAPENPTVIHISGRCRMGQVIDKRHLGMVYESSSDPNADTLLQGLVGRVCGYDTTTDIDVYVSRSSEEHIADYSKAWSVGDIELLSKITKAMNLSSGGRKMTLKAKDKNGLEIMPIHPILIPGGLLEIEHKGDLGWQIHQCLLENPGLIKCRDDAEEIKRRIIDYGKVHKSTGTSREEDEQILKSSVMNHKRMRPGKLKAVNNTPQKYTLEENPFILYKRKGSTDYYLGGWVRYREEIHAKDEVDRPTPKVSPECNYVPGDEPIPESSERESQKSSGFTPSGQSSKEYLFECSKKKCGSPSRSSQASQYSQVSKSSKTASVQKAECEVYEIGPMPRMVCEVDTTEEFIGTVRNLNNRGLRSYRPVWMAENPEAVPVHLKMDVFSKEEIERIKKQLKAELGIKLVVKGTPGRPRKCEDYRKIQEITW